MYPLLKLPGKPATGEHDRWVKTSCSMQPWTPFVFWAWHESFQQRSCKHRILRHKRNAVEHEWVGHGRMTQRGLGFLHLIILIIHLSIGVPRSIRYNLLEKSWWCRQLAPYPRQMQRRSHGENQPVPYSVCRSPIKNIRSPTKYWSKSWLRRESSLESEALPARNCWSSVFLHGSVDDQTSSLLKYAKICSCHSLIIPHIGNWWKLSKKCCGDLWGTHPLGCEKRSCLMWAQWAAWIPGADECAYTMPCRRCCRCWQMMGSISKALPFVTPNAGTCQD